MKEKIREYIRILKLTKKPDWKEYSTIAKTTSVGLLIIGFIGFIIYLIFNLVIGGFT